MRTRVHHLPPLHLFRTEYSNGKYFGVCIGCKWRGKPKSKYDDAVHAGRLHCETSNLAEQAKLRLATEGTA